MYQTPWTKKSSASSLTSDRLHAKTGRPPLTSFSKSKNIQSNSENALPDSKALRTLHALRSSLQDPSTSTGKDPTGGCFCQVRMHPLSTYVPICTSCALPLCNLVAPAYLCPSCSEPLISAAQRKALIARLDSEIADTTLEEQLTRERAEEERRAAAGAFPALSSTSSPSTPPYPTPSPSPKPIQPQLATAVTQTHKVLSLNSKSKKVVLKTTTVRPVSASSTPTPSRPPSPLPTRVPRPTTPTGWSGKSAPSVKEDRPFENFLVGSLVYVPPVRVGDDDGREEEGGNSEGRKRRRGRAKQKAKQSNSGVGDNLAI